MGYYAFELLMHQYYLSTFLMKNNGHCRNYWFIELETFYCLSYCVLNHYDLTNQCYRQNTLTNTGGHMHARTLMHRQKIL